ncbi:hypothetical protein ACHAQH_004022 [Verticillium albo-atrum]
MLASKLSAIVLLTRCALAQVPPQPTRGATQSLYGQCGGANWEYATACAPGSTCYNDGNPWYSQCVAFEHLPPNHSLYPGNGATGGFDTYADDADGHHHHDETYYNQAYHDAEDFDVYYFEAPDDKCEASDDEHEITSRRNDSGTATWWRGHYADAEHDSRADPDDSLAVSGVLVAVANLVGERDVCRRKLASRKR